MWHCLNQILFLRVLRQLCFVFLESAPLSLHWDFVLVRHQRIDKLLLLGVRFYFRLKFKLGIIEVTTRLYAYVIILKILGCISELLHSTLKHGELL